MNDLLHSLLRLRFPKLQKRYGITRRSANKLRADLLEIAGENVEMEAFEPTLPPEPAEVPEKVEEPDGPTFVATLKDLATVLNITGAELKELREKEGAPEKTDEGYPVEAYFEFLENQSE